MNRSEKVGHFYNRALGLPKDRGVKCYKGEKIGVK